MEISTPITVSLQRAESPQYGAALPDCPGVYAFRDGTEIVHIGWSPRLRTRVVRLLSRVTSGNSTVGSRMRDAGLVLSCWPTGSRLESSFVMYQVLRSDCPSDYRKRLRLNLPWFVTLTTRDPFPRLAVSRRIPSREEPAFGPFKSRDSAQLYADDVLGCFRLRRCADSLTPDPAHPGCIYGEINQCLRPCQQAISEPEYEAEVQRVSSFLSTNGDSSLAGLVSARDEAARALRFERAAELHKSIAKVKAIAEGREDLVCDVRGMGGFALTKGTGERAVLIWPMSGGLWQESHRITVGESATPDSLAGLLKESLSPFGRSNGEMEADRSEHLAILLRWYYSSSRDGYWYPIRPDKNFNFRRVSKAMLNMANPKKTSSSTAG